MALQNPKAHSRHWTTPPQNQGKPKKEKPLSGKRVPSNAIVNSKIENKNAIAKILTHKGRSLQQPAYTRSNQ